MKDNIKKDVGKRIAGVRINIMKMSQEEFAQILDVPYEYLEAVESGENCLTIEKIILLCEKANISIDYLLLGKTNDNDILRNLLRGFTDKQINYVSNVINKNISLRKISLKKAFTESIERKNKIIIFPVKN